MGERCLEKDGTPTLLKWNGTRRRRRRMLDHTRLLKRATEVFGLNDHVLNWLKSYLTYRSSYVSLANCHSTTVGCTTGEPQGSVLGPLLFSIFTTPVGRLISTYNISYHQFADDAQLYTSVDSSPLADITRLVILCRGSEQVAYQELSVAQSVKIWGTCHRHSSTSRQVKWCYCSFTSLPVRRN